MAELAKANKIKVILTSVLPAAAFKWRMEIKDVPQKIKSLNDRIEAYAKANNYLYFDDSSDYGVGLWEVIRTLRPDLAEKWDNSDEYIALEYIEEED